jgi:hypothetical protein
MVQREIRGAEPPCEQCWPGVLERNEEAWEVYQLAVVDSMGISPSGVLAICQTLNVADPAECLMKITNLVTTIRGLKEEIRGPKEDNG